jgi:hypothetical protein
LTGFWIDDFFRVSFADAEREPGGMATQTTARHKRSSQISTRAIHYDGG